MSRRLVAVFLLLCLLLLNACARSVLTDLSDPSPESAPESAAEKGAAEDETEEPPGAGYAAGFAKADITPEDSVPLAGYGNVLQRMSNNVLDPLYVCCAVLQDEAGERLYFFQFDISGVPEELRNMVCSLASRAVDAKPENILVNASHTHSGPNFGSDTTGIARWKGKLYKAITQVAKDAVADLDPLTDMAIGRKDTDRLNFTRRYFATDGFVTDNFDNRKSGGAITAHEFAADPQMQVLCLTRETRPDIVLVNWQCHPHRTGGSKKYDISSDIIGVMRQEAEDELGIGVIYLQGGAGNINPTSRLTGEARFTEYKEIGHDLAQTLLTAYRSAEPVSMGAVRVAETDLTIFVDHSKDQLLAEAATVNEIWTSTNDKSAAMAEAKKYGISSVYEAGAIVTKAKMGESRDVTIRVYAFGDFAVAAAPFEMFSNTGQTVKTDSPFPATFFCGYSNGSLGYMPAAECFPHLGYEVVTCKYVQGTAEQIAETQLSMLNELAARAGASR